MSDPPSNDPRAMATRLPSVSLVPGTGWNSLIDSHVARRGASPQAQLFRRELGLPTDQPIVMSGHQAQWWHAGILAKQIALAAVCQRAGAAAGWVVVDQDASESLALAYPSKPRSGVMPVKAVWSVAPAALSEHSRADVALCDIPAFEPSPTPGDAVTTDVTRGLRAIADAAARWRHTGNAAQQIARANAELVSAALGDGAAAPLVFATSLLNTTAGRALLEQMADDPRGCVEAYNQAVRESGLGTIAPLSCAPDKGRYELPLWALSAQRAAPSPRRRVFAASLGDTPFATLAPRGVLMTALVRWLGCDLFIHGMGGGATGEQGGYDKVAERWLRLWLNAELAPSVVATATAALPMGVDATVTEDDLRAAHRQIEDARHAPRTLGDTAAQQEKDELVAAIAAAADRHERHRLYRRLQQRLEAYRDTHRGELSAATARARQAGGDLAVQAVLRDRTWPWPLLPRTMVLELRRRIAAQLAE